MRTLFLIVVAFVFPVISEAQTNDDLRQANEEKRILICSQLSDARCFGREVNSICMVDAQKAQAGFCRARTNRYDQEYVTCRCY